MPKYYYMAVNEEGVRMPGVLECESESRLADILDAKGLTIIEASTSPRSKKSKKALAGGSVGPDERAVLAVQMARLIESACPMDRALELAQGIVRTQRMHDAIVAINQDVTQGASLHDAMARHPDVFPPLFLASVRAGEAGGFLATAFNRLGEFELNQDRLRRKIISSLIYPVFMVGVVGVCLIVIFVFVVPNLVSFFQSSGMDLPVPTKILIWISHHVSEIILAFIALIGAFVGLRLTVGRTPTALLKEDRLILSLPYLGHLISSIMLARFCRTMGLLLDGGVAVTQALEITQQAISNRVYLRDIEMVARQVTSGESLSSSLELCDTFPDMLCGQVRFGEETGSLARTMASLADEHERTTEAALDAIVGLVEPMIIVVMGGVMGYVVLSVFMPMVTMVNIK